MRFGARTYKRMKTSTPISAKKAPSASVPPVPSATVITVVPSVAVASSSPSWYDMTPTEQQLPVRRGWLYYIFCGFPLHI
jgi:hypothetical protein